MTKISEEDRNALVDLVREEIVKHQNGKIERMTTNEELAQILEVDKSTIKLYLNRLPDDLRMYRTRKIQSQTLGSLWKRPEFMEANKERATKIIEELNSDQAYQQAHKKIMKNLHKNPEYRRKLKEGLERKYADQAYMQALREKARERLRERRTHPEFVESCREASRRNIRRLLEDPANQQAHIERTIRRNREKESRERSRKIMTGFHTNPKFRQKLRERSIKLVESYRKNSYFVENRLYASSIEEGAAALMLEKYVTGYIVSEGVNFQVKNRGMQNGGIDFLVNDEFLEWHPPISYYKSRGDIQTAEELESYKAIIKELSGDEKKAFENEYKIILSANYINRRRDTIKDSGYKNIEVKLATNEKELYEFIQKHPNTLPDYGTFHLEFRHKQKEVKKYKVEEMRKAA